MPNVVTPVASYQSTISPTATSDRRKRRNTKRDANGKPKDKAQQKRYNINKQLFAASNKDRIGAILAQQASVFDADNIAVAMHCLGHSKRCVGWGVDGDGMPWCTAHAQNCHRPDDATIAEVLQLAEDNIDQLLPHHLAVCVWYAGGFPPRWYTCDTNTCTHHAYYTGPWHACDVPNSHC